MNSVVFEIASCPGVGKQVCRAKRKSSSKFYHCYNFAKCLSRFPKEALQLTIGRISCRFAQDCTRFRSKEPPYSYQATYTVMKKNLFRLRLLCLYIWSVIPKLSSSCD
ncbi:hypothetical protein E2320_018218 [Naja naja]|nr:hypothetical protein E2320_018218 [Naja naja]